MRLQHSFVEIKKSRYKVVSSPLPHILVFSKKQLHGWYEGLNPYGRRECTSERLLINPYNGCSNNCFYCYAHSYPGYLELFKDTGIITVFSDFDRQVAKQLDSLNIVSCGYLSPVSDPFQEINSFYRLSEKIIFEYVKRNIPIEFITKYVIPDDVVDLIKKQEHSFGQISILTLDEKLRKAFSKSGATTCELLQNFRKLKKNNIYSVARIDPIFPFITDSPTDLKNLIQAVKDSGADHIIASCVDIPVKIKEIFFNGLKNIDRTLTIKYKDLYTEQIGYFLNAKIEYRWKLFTTLKDICKKANITFALCMEYMLTDEKINKRYKVVGLNRYFATSLNCEGKDVPLYRRDGEKFKPVKNCKGNCMVCSASVCGIPELKYAPALKLKDYRRWSKLYYRPTLFQHLHTI